MTDNQKARAYDSFKEGVTNFTGTQMSRMEVLNTLNGIEKIITDYDKKQESITTKN